MERLTKNKIKSNLPFQIILHVKLWLFPIWLLIVIISLDFRYSNITDIYNVVTLTIFLILSVSESLKLYLGYLGNLGGKIPELAACWLISTLIQFPLEMFLAFNYGTLSIHYNILINYFMICFLFLEIIMGAIALKNLASLRAKIFYLAQLYNRCDKC